MLSAAWLARSSTFRFYCGDKPSSLSPSLTSTVSLFFPSRTKRGGKEGGNSANLPEKKTAALPRSEVTAARRRKRLFFASAETKDERGRCEGIPNDPSQSELGHATPQPIPRHCPRGTRWRKGNQTVKQRQPTRCCTAAAPISPLFCRAQSTSFLLVRSANGRKPEFPPLLPSNLATQTRIGDWKCL